jgi:hypothetical protein
LQMLTIRNTSLPKTYYPRTSSRADGPEGLFSRDGLLESSSVDDGICPALRIG